MEGGGSRADVNGAEVEDTDADVIARSWEDPSAFAVVFDRHYHAIHRFLWVRVGQAAEDVAAEVFRIAFERRRDYEIRYPSAKPWLFGIASRQAKEHHRSRARIRELRRRATTEVGSGSVAGPEEHLQELALSSPVAEALLQLADRDRDAILLYAWEGMAYEEIARALETPVGTVRSRIHRARRVLRDHLGPAASGVDGRDDDG